MSRSIMPNAAHIAFMDDLKAVLGKHVELTAPEMLAVAAQFVGNLTALQDQTRYTPAAVMSLVARNIEIGNQAAIDGLLDTKGSA